MDDVSEIPGLDPRSPGPSEPGLAYDPIFAGFVARTYLDRLGESIVPAALDPAAAARWLYEEAPFCLLVHNTAADPRFVYANRAAQACFEYGWDEITALPSRLSAETPNRAERQDLLEAVTRAGFATGYRGRRIAKSGRRFWIENVTVWQLANAKGTLRGQAAAYRAWRDA